MRADELPLVFTVMGAQALTRGARVRVSGENGEHEGLCGNAAADGSLMLHTGADIHLLISGGDVSLIRLPA